MEGEGDEIKSKQASKRGRTLLIEAIWYSISGPLSCPEGQNVGNLWSLASLQVIQSPLIMN